MMATATFSTDLPGDIAVEILPAPRQSIRGDAGWRASTGLLSPSARATAFMKETRVLSPSRTSYVTL
jgi:hypothetical protein